MIALKDGTWYLRTKRAKKPLDIFCPPDLLVGMTDMKWRWKKAVGVDGWKQRVFVLGFDFKSKECEESLKVLNNRPLVWPFVLEKEKYD